MIEDGAIYRKPSHRRGCCTLLIKQTEYSTQRVPVCSSRRRCRHTCIWVDNHKQRRDGDWKTSVSELLCQCHGFDGVGFPSMAVFQSAFQGLHLNPTPASHQESSQRPEIATSNNTKNATFRSCKRTLVNVSIGLLLFTATPAMALKTEPTNNVTDTGQGLIAP